MKSDCYIISPNKVKEFLALMNQGKEQSEWQLTCILFAPNSPEQNPVEDVWLQGKNFLRNFWQRLKSFSIVKWLFQFCLSHQKFDFPKIGQSYPIGEQIFRGTKDGGGAPATAVLNSNLIAIHKYSPYSVLI